MTSPKIVCLPVSQSVGATVTMDQIMADVTGIPVVQSTTNEATCLGAGILAAVGGGWYADVRAAADAMTGTAARYVPAPATMEVYNRLYQEVYRTLFPTLQAALDRLSLLTHGPGEPRAEPRGASQAARENGEST